MAEDKQHDGETVSPSDDQSASMVTTETVSAADSLELTDTTVTAVPLLEDAPTPLSEEEVKARRKRNIAIAFGILAFIAIVYSTTILRYAANNTVGG